MYQTQIVTKSKPAYLNARLELRNTRHEGITTVFRPSSSGHREGVVTRNGLSVVSKILS